MRFILLPVLMYVFCSLTNDSSVKNKSNFFHQEQTDTLTVFGNCKMCKNRIEKSILGKIGVVAVNWDIKTKLLTVTFHPFDTSLDDIQKMIIESGHDTRKYKAENFTYNKLPECCKYR